MIQALMDQVVIEPIEETVSKGGIIITAKKDNRIPGSEGTVVAVGPGKWENGIFVKTLLQAGSRVLYHNYPTGVDYETPDRKHKYVVIQERQVVAVVEQKDGNAKA